MRRLMLTVTIGLLAGLFAQSLQAQHVAVLSYTQHTGYASLWLEDSNDTPNYWRLERSTNLVDWLTVDAGEAIHGLARFSHAVVPQETVGAAFYRTVLDNTASNALNLPASPFNYAAIALPAHLQTPAEQAADNTPAANPITDAGATLGRVLFHDKRLSINHTVACASCHVASQGFSDTNRFSVGFEGGLTGRNSMGLSSAKFYASGRFFWDERANTLEDQVLAPIQDTTEMGMTLTGLVSRLQGYTYYQELFTDAFGDSTVTTGRISRALAQFVRSIVSYQSRFDQGVPIGFSNFTAQEQLGRDLFTGPRGNCAACHAGPHFVGVRIENNGLEFPYGDPGVGGVTGAPQDLGKFKMSSLRNIEHTAPYMHDGRFATLEDVVDFYSTGVVFNANLGPPLRVPGPPGQPPLAEARRPNFTAEERAALVAFLKTLTDTAVLSDEKYSDPFR